MTPFLNPSAKRLYDQEILRSKKRCTNHVVLTSLQFILKTLFSLDNGKQRRGKKRRKALQQQMILPSFLMYIRRTSKETSVQKNTNNIQLATKRDG